MIGSVWKIFEIKDQLVNELMNDGGDFRTAPATTGMLKNLKYFYIFSILRNCLACFKTILYIWVIMFRKNSDPIHVIFSPSL